MLNSDPDGYFAAPSSGHGPGVLVLHAWWGLNDVIKDVCQRLADEGFFAFAPDLYEGRLATTVEEAESFSSQLDDNKTEAVISKAVDFLWQKVGNEDQHLAVIGFSLGAYYALNLSAQDPERVRAVVLFYGTGSADFTKSKAAYLGHFAETDPYEPTEYVNNLESSLKSASKEVTFYHYQNVGHWFFESDRSDAFHEPSAVIAWERTVAFLKHALFSSDL